MSKDTYRAFEVTGVRKFALVDRRLDDAAPGQVRGRVEACGAPRWGLQEACAPPGPSAAC